MEALSPSNRSSIEPSASFPSVGIERASLLTGSSCARRGRRKQCKRRRAVGRVRRPNLHEGSRPSSWPFVGLQAQSFSADASNKKAQPPAAAGGCARGKGSLGAPQGCRKIVRRITGGAKARSGPPRWPAPAGRSRTAAGPAASRPASAPSQSPRPQSGSARRSGSSASSLGSTP